MVSLYSKLRKFLLRGGREKRTETFVLLSDGLKVAVRSECPPNRAAGWPVQNEEGSSGCFQWASAEIRQIQKAEKCPGWSGASSCFSVLEMVSVIKLSSPLFTCKKKGTAELVI